MTSTETKTAAANESAPAKAAKAAPAKKAPAKSASAAKAAPVPAARKLRWQVEGERNQKGGKNQTAKVDDHTYAISRAGEGWTATVTVNGKATLLVTEGKFSAAYTACVKHNRERA